MAKAIRRRSEGSTEFPHAKGTTFVYRPDAKFPWLISQKNHEVKLSESQMHDFVRLVGDVQSRYY